MWLPKASNQALRRQCTCVGYVRAEQWARFIWNLHLRTSVWYSSNWIGPLCSAQARKSERAIGRFIRDTSTSRAPHWFEIHNFWITILTFFCFEAILKSYIPSVPFLLIWVVDRTFFRHQCGLILVPDWQNHGTSWSNLFNDTFGRVLWITALRFWLLNED